MAVPRPIADVIARLAQKGPGGSRRPSEVSFAEIPASTEDIRIPTRHGSLPATVYSPPQGMEGRGVYVNLHGGGFILRHPEQDDPLCRYLAAEAEVTVINVDYIPAPQCRFPGPVEQAYDVALWAAEKKRPWDGTRCAIGGQSAGGALAAGAARLALEHGGPELALQMLMYPPLDLSIPAAQKLREGKETFLARMGPIFDVVYCPDATDRRSRLASPAGDHDTAPLDGIAPALIITCGRDILRDEGIRYAERLERAGSLRGHVDLPEVGHGFNLIGATRQTVLPVYERIAEEVGQQLKTGP